MNKLIKQLNVELESMCIWFKSNNLIIIEYAKINFYIVFHRARLKTIHNSSMDIIMDNQVLTKVNLIKYLGIIVDHKLNCLDNITYVKAKISKGMGIIYKARKYLNKTLQEIYTMLTFI